MTRECWAKLADRIYDEFNTDAPSPERILLAVGRLVREAASETERLSREMQDVRNLIQASRLRDAVEVFFEWSARTGVNR